MKKNPETPRYQREKKLFEFESVDLTKTFPEWKSPLLSADYMFIQAYRELNLIQKRLQEKEKEMEFYSIEMNNKWNELKKKQEDFLNDVENFNKFFIDNEHKCRRVREKITAEIEFRKKCENDIHEVQDEVENLKLFENEIKYSVHFLKPFHNYLKNITEQIHYFSDVGDIINYYVLLNSQTKLQETLNGNLMKTEELHSKLLRSLKIKISTHTQQRNELLEMEKNDRHASYDSKKWKEILKEKEKQTDYVNEEHILMKQACDNIFQRLCKWKKINFLQVTSDAEKLSFIEDTVGELQNAVRFAFDLNYKDDVSCKADSSCITEKRMI